jgi:hypothetical protein
MSSSDPFIHRLDASMAYIVLAIAALLAALFAAAMRPGANLAAEYAVRLRNARIQTQSAAAALTESDIASLPDPLKRYLRRSGAIGKPPVRAFSIDYQSEMFQSPGSAPMPGPAYQFNLLQPYRRLFLMRSRMLGMPVAVLHDYAGTQASMQVRVAQLFDVVNVRSAELARTETVTLLNDLCFFAPSALIGTQFAWRPIDEQHTEVTFTNGPHQVKATLTINPDGDLVNFASADRGGLQKDGRFVLEPWSTPMHAFREFAGRRVPTRGEAIWHRPEGDFVYGRFVLKSIRYDENA